MNPFNNPQLEVSSLPQATHLDYQGLEPAYRTVLLISNTIFWLVLGIGILSVLAVKADEIPNFIFPIVSIVLSTICVFSFLSIFFGFRNKSFAVRAHDLHYNAGWLWKSKTVVPFKRIQHSEVSQGPIDRLFNLGKLRVFTAGGSGSDLVIPGLSFEDANTLKTLITSKISNAEPIDSKVEEHRGFDNLRKDILTPIFLNDHEEE